MLEDFVYIFFCFKINTYICNNKSIYNLKTI